MDLRQQVLITRVFFFGQGVEGKYSSLVRSKLTLDIVAHCATLKTKMVIKGLIWDEWNRDHLSKHKITIEEVEEVCHGKFKVAKSYRKRIMLIGKTKKGRRLAVVLSPEDRNLKAYREETYYLITSYEKEVEL